MPSSLIRLVTSCLALPGAAGGNSNLHGARAVPRSLRQPSIDIYAVGVMLYYLLSGRLPSGRHDPGTDPAASGTASSRYPGHLETVPERLAEIVARCLAKDPAGRFLSSLELADELRVVIQQLRDTESLIRDSLRGLDCFVQGSRDTFRIILPQQRGERLQE